MPAPPSSGKSLRSLRKAASETSGNYLSDSPIESDSVSRGKRKFTRRGSSSVKRVPSLNLTLGNDDREEEKEGRSESIASMRSRMVASPKRSLSSKGSFDSTGRDSPTSPMPSTPTRRFVRSGNTRLRSNAALDEENLSSFSDIIKSSSPSGQREQSISQHLGRNISPHHPQSSNKVSKFKEDRQMRELRRRIKSPCDGREEKSEETKPRNSVPLSNNDDDDGRDFDFDSDGDADKDPWASPSPAPPPEANKNAALSLNFSKLSEKDDSEVTKSRKKVIGRQRSSSLMPGFVPLQACEEAEKSKVFLPFKGHHSRQKRRASSAHLDDLTLRTLDEGKSPLVFGMDVVTPKVAIPKMFKQRAESPVAGKPNRRGSISNFFGGTFGDLKPLLTDEVTGTGDVIHHRKRSVLKIHRKRSILKIGKDALLSTMGSGKASESLNAARDRLESLEEAAKPKPKASLRMTSLKERRKQKPNDEDEESGSKKGKHHKEGKKDNGGKEDDDNSDKNDDDNDDSYDNEGTEDEETEDKAEESENGDVTCIAANDFWSHKAMKLTGGDKGRVRKTVRLDPYNIKRALDPETWNTIRYMEGVVVESGNGRVHGYYSCIICEDRIIFLPLSGVKFTEVVFREFGKSGHIIMVPAHEIVSVGYLRGEENSAMLWGDDDWNARSLHLKLNLLSESSVPSGTSKKTKLAAQMHIYTFEQNSKVMFHISNMWLDCFTRMKAKIPLIKEESEIELATGFLQEVERIISKDKRMYQDHIHALSYLASELVNDMTLKHQFFTDTAVFAFAYHCIKEFEEDMAYEKGSKGRCLMVLRRLVVCFKLIYAALFNSTSIASRYQFYFLGNTMLEHIAWYARDFHSFTQSFVITTGFTPVKLTINDVKKLSSLRQVRKSLGKGRKPGLMSRGSMKAVLDLEDDERENMVEKELAKKAGKGRKSLNKKSPRSPRSPRGSGISPRSPRSIEENKEMFHTLTDVLTDFQVALLVQLQDMVTNYNLECHNLQGRYKHESRDTVATRMKQAHEGFAEIGFNFGTFFDVIFQRMISLIDDIKIMDGNFAPNQSILDKLENLNFVGPDLSPRGHSNMEDLLEVEDAKGLHNMNQPTIAMYNYSRLLYNLVNDDIFTREEARMSGEEEIRSFIGNRENLAFFRHSGDIHLQLAVSFIKKTQNWMGIKGMGHMGQDVDVVDGGMFDLDDDFDIE